jgi:hypothetical protein
MVAGHSCHPPEDVVVAAQLPLARVLQEIDHHLLEEVLGFGELPDARSHHEADAVQEGLTEPEEQFPARGNAFVTCKVEKIKAAEVWILHAAKSR